MISKLLGEITFNETILPEVFWNKGQRPVEVNIYGAMGSFLWAINRGKISSFKLKDEKETTLIESSLQFYNYLNKDVDYAEKVVLNLMSNHEQSELIVTLSRFQQIKLVVPESDRYLRNSDLAELILMASKVFKNRYGS